jgi:hypothetical protein
LHDVEEIGQLALLFGSAGFLNAMELCYRSFVLPDEALGVDADV